MTDKPINFSDYAVRAARVGRKTQHRIMHPVLGGTPEWRIGGRLWVREAWKSDRAYDDLAPSEMGGDEPLIYVADNEVQRWGWKPDVLSRWGRYRHARFMPRWASRLTLTVTDVRVQRLQEISETDARAEGWPGPVTEIGYPVSMPLQWFPDIWNSLHGPDAWDANPWVCALTFTVERRNIDA